jgi:hypothetical protein
MVVCTKGLWPKDPVRISGIVPDKVTWATGTLLT